MCNKVSNNCLFWVFLNIDMRFYSLKLTTLHRLEINVAPLVWGEQDGTTQVSIVWCLSIETLSVWHSTRQCNCLATALLLFNVYGKIILFFSAILIVKLQSLFVRDAVDGNDEICNAHVARSWNVRCCSCCKWKVMTMRCDGNWILKSKNLSEY